jgi:hypothetical protein
MTGRCRRFRRRFNSPRIRAQGGDAGRTRQTTIPRSSTDLQCGAPEPFERTLFAFIAWQYLTGSLLLFLGGLFND